VLAFSFLFLFLGALLGGIRALLIAVQTQHPKSNLGERHREMLTKELEKRSNLPQAAGFTRIILISIAAILFIYEISGDIKIIYNINTIIFILFAGFLLEIIPSLVLRNRACNFVLAFLPINTLFYKLTFPITKLIEKALTSIDAQDLSEEEALSENEQKMIDNVVELSEADAASAMTPRTELTAVHINTTPLECLKIMNDAGHSRVPIYGESLDDMLGIAYLKDLTSFIVNEGSLKNQKLENHIRAPYFIPETKSVSELLEEMRSKKIHLAIAIDEYGGTAGVISIEDILEEIVGEIQDEHDEQEEHATIRNISEKIMRTEGRLPISELNEALGCHLPHDEDYETIAGLLFDRLGRIPAKGEFFETEEIIIKVLKVDERRIHFVEIEVKDEPKD
jgi:CBS domain containing-hemolysin-like protein